jgi:hypothetical protein
MEDDDNITKDIDYYFSGKRQTLLFKQRVSLSLKLHRHNNINNGNKIFSLSLIVISLQSNKRNFVIKATFRAFSP